MLFPSRRTRALTLWQVKTPESFKTDMVHRHLNHEEYTIAAIDDIIARGKRTDWLALQRALLAGPELKEKILSACQAHLADPYEQRYRLWKLYVERKFT